MYILTERQREIINSEFVERFMIATKDDASLILASYRIGDGGAVTIGRYADDKEAKDVLSNLFGALANRSTYYTMPESSYYAKETWKRDARTKRRGGS